MKHTTETLNDAIKAALTGDVPQLAHIDPPLWRSIKSEVSAIVAKGQVVELLRE